MGDIYAGHCASLRSDIFTFTVWVWEMSILFLLAPVYHIHAIFLSASTSFSHDGAVGVFFSHRFTRNTRWELVSTCMYATSWLFFHFEQ